MTDLSQSFNHFIRNNFATVRGCLIEILPDKKFRWNGITGTREEIEKAINDAGMNIKNSLKK